MIEHNVKLPRIVRFKGLPRHLRKGKDLQYVTIKGTLYVRIGSRGRITASIPDHETNYVTGR